MEFEGHGVLIVAKDTVNGWPLCLGLGNTGNLPKLVSCFHDAVVPTLAQGWETGAVILEETLPHNRWSVGPCTTDGKLERLLVPDTSFSCDFSAQCFAENGSHAYLSFLLIGHRLR